MAGKAQPPAETSTGGALQGPSAYALLLRKMASMATLEETMGTGQGAEDIDRILTAETEEEMWDADELAKWNATKLSGCNLQTVGFEVRFNPPNEEIKSAYIDPETSNQMFLLVHSFRINSAGNTKEYNLPPVGELFTWNTSARSIVPKFFWMLANGWFDDGAKPVRFRIEGTKTKAGSVEKLKPLTPGTIIEAETAITVEATEPLPF